LLEILDEQNTTTSVRDIYSISVSVWDIKVIRGELQDVKISEERCGVYKKHELSDEHSTVALTTKRMAGEC
jgi:hypothetical protein